MTWAALEPVVKRVPHVKASISVTKLGPKLHIVFSDSFLKSLGTPKNCEMFAGKDENVGKMRILFKKGAKFAVTEQGYGGAKMNGPVFAGIPDGAREAEECTILSQTPDELVIQLPVVAWDKQVATPAKPVVMKAAPKKDDAPSVMPSAKLDLVPYLTKCGYTVMRMSESGFKIDRERRTINEAIAIANKHRQRAGLPPVTIADVR